MPDRIETRLVVKVVKNRKRFTVESGNGNSESLKSWCDRQSIAYQAIHLRLRDLPQGVFYDKLKPAVFGWAQYRKQRAEVARSRAARSINRLTPSQSRDFIAALKAMQRLAQSLDLDGVVPTSNTGKLSHAESIQPADGVSVLTDPSATRAETGPETMAQAEEANGLEDAHGAH